MTLLAVVFLVGTAEAVSITQCGQTVPAGETGDLMNDMVCGATMGVILTDGATLNLNGFSIVGAGLGFIDPNALPYHGVFAGVLCNIGPNPISGAGVRTCEVNGPGEHLKPLYRDLGHGQPSAGGEGPHHSREPGRDCQ
jgi:hypothetical protein